MVASAQALSKYIEPLLNNPDTDHLQTIRFGTKALAHWPATFTTDDDAAAKLALFKRIQDAEKLVSIQAHFTHPVELKTKAVKQAIRNIQAAGAIIRTQAPIIRGINDSADCWAEMWNLQTRLGLVPYYALVQTQCIEFFAFIDTHLPGLWNVILEPKNTLEFLFTELLKSFTMP
jgi:L-lysine 2,3-aminomutase